MKYQSLCSHAQTQGHVSQVNHRLFISSVDQEKGAIAVKSGEIFECKAEENLSITDLTGAGDLFAAGYLHGIINNMSSKESLQKGTELSSKIIQKIGARI